MASTGLLLLYAFAILATGIANTGNLMLIPGLLIGLGLLAYRVVSTWKASSRDEATNRRAFFYRLATTSDLNEVISKDDFVDTYYFGTTREGEVQAPNHELATRILVACIDVFRHRRASGEGGEQAQSYNIRVD